MYMESLLRDLRHGFRMLRKNPALTAIAVLTLALGIGANTAIFSVVNGVLLRPLPYPESERLVTLWERSPRLGFDQERVSPPNFADWQEQNSVLDHLAYWYGSGEFNLVTSDGVEKVRCVYASSGMFHALGVSPSLGRTFLPEEDQPQGNRVAVISYEFWQRRLAADSNVLGQALTVDTFGRQDYTIIGVMPRGFRFPDQCELWLPAGWNGLPRDRRGGHWLSVIARLKPGVTLQQAQTEMDAIQARIEQQHQQVVLGSQVAMVPLLEQTLGARLRLALLVLWGVVACVLLIACANVANLMLARAAARQGEMAIRLAVGASRWQVARHLLTESVLLSIAGGLVGILVAVWSLDLLIALNSDQIPRLNEVKIDGPTLCFTLLVSMLTGILFGLAPALQSSKPDLGDALKEGGRRNSEGFRGNRLRRSLVAAEVALSLVLLIAAGLMANSFARLLQIDRGFQQDRLLTVQLDFSVSGFTTWMRPTQTRPQVTLRELMGRVRDLPGVQSVGSISTLPKNIATAWRQTIVIENSAPSATGDFTTANFQGITPDYLSTMGIPLVEGRNFTEADSLEAPQVALINETMVARYFSNENPVGKRLAMGARNPGPSAGANQFAPVWIEIVGVVRDIKRMNLSAETVPDVYIPYWQYPMQSPSLVVRTAENPSTVAAAIRGEVKAVNQNLPAPTIQTMDEILSDAVAQPRLQTMLLGLFGLVALVLASVGIYGVLAYAVAKRTREIGIRMALGAQTGDVVKLIIAQGMKPALLGIGIGLAFAFALTRVMRSLLYEISATDPVTFIAVALLLISVALLACWIPARRATKMDPMMALRDD
jgi:putative ABC transport system permease protein